MKIVLKWFAFGLIVFLVALIYTIPAHLVFPYLPSSVYIGQIKGTLWNAHAIDFAFNDFSLSEIKWRIQPLYLLTGRIKTSIDFSHSDMSGSGDIIFAKHSLDLEDFHVTGNAAVIDPYINTFGGSINGKFDLSLESLDITQPGPQSALGRLVVSNTQLNSPAEFSLGNIELDLAQQDKSAVAILANSATNTLKLSGSANINPEWRYSSDIHIAPTSSTPEAIRQTLSLLGKTDVKGSVTIKQSGQIPILHWLPFLQDG